MTAVALTFFVDTMLPEQHDGTGQQPHELLFAFLWRDWLVTSEPVSESLKVLHKQSIL